MAFDQELENLVAEALAARARGETPALDQLCRHRPDLTAAVDEAVRLAAEFRVLHEAATSHDANLGKVLGGRYRLDRRIGEGAMGIVYRAFDQELGRAVAVKILRSDLLVGAAQRARFEREAEVLAAIAHPAVVTVFDRGVEPPALAFLVMELLEGRPLVELLDRAAERARSSGLEHLTAADLLPDTAPAADGRGYLQVAAGWIADLASGLGAAHDVGARHRDIKPSNIFVRADGRPVLIDFGIAARADHATLAAGSDALGTPAYMPAELLQQGAEASSASDIYSLAATLYHLVTLRPPYSGTASQVLARMQRRDPIPAQRLRRGLPRDLQAILDRAMARAPAARYASARAFAADLRAFLAFQPVSARPIGPVRRTARAAWRVREVRVAGAIALCLAAAFGASAWQDARAAARSARFSTLYATLPPALSLQQNPAARVVRNDELRAQIAARLDEAVLASDRAVPIRVLRAAFRSDHGDAAGAAADQAAVAAASSPGSAAAGFVEAYERYRRRTSADEVPAIVSLLQAPPLAEDLAAGELLALAQLDLGDRAGDRAGKLEHWRAARDTAIRLAARHGPTATTEFVLATALVGEDRAPESLAAFARATALSPFAFGIRRNHGVALRRCEQLEAAAHELQAAIALRGDLPEVFETLVRVHADRSDWGSAAAVLERTPYPASPLGDGRRQRMLGEIELLRARAADYAGDGLAQARHSAAAAEHFHAAVAAGVNPAATDLALCEAWTAHDLGAALPAFWRSLASQPTNWRLLRDLVHLLPDDLSPADSDALRAWLGALLAHQAPHLPAPNPEPTKR